MKKLASIPLFLFIVLTIPGCSKFPFFGKENKEEIINVYSVNDFHGSILERQSSYYEGGLLKVFGQLKKYKDSDPEHTIILCGGDMFQGSLESNMNDGHLILEAMNYVGFDAMTIGNHDFDYGIDKLFENMELANFPFLAGNIVDYSSKENWGKSQLSTTIQCGDIKVGIMGCIGEGQTTSIQSNIVENLSFENPATYFKQGANQLDNDGCDLIIGQVHDSFDNAQEYGNLSNKIHGIFLGHSHNMENKKYYGIPYLQGACNGEYISHMQFSIDKKKNVKCLVSENIKSLTSWSEDPEIQKIEDKYFDEKYQSLVKDEVGSLTFGYKISKDQYSNILAKALHKYASDKGYEICCSMISSIRSTVPSPFTYSDLYKAYPFSNNLVILNVSGNSIKKEAAYSSTYTENVEKFQSLSSQENYTIITTQYLAYHKNTRKRYDYFEELNYSNNLILEELEIYPVDIVSSYIKNELGGKVNISQFQGKSQGFNIFI